MKVSRNEIENGKQFNGLARKNSGLGCRLSSIISVKFKTGDRSTKKSIKFN